MCDIFLWGQLVSLRGFKMKGHTTTYVRFHLHMNKIVERNAKIPFGEQIRVIAWDNGPVPLLLSSLLPPSLLLAASQTQDGIRPNWHKIFWDGQVGHFFSPQGKSAEKVGWTLASEPTRKAILPRWETSRNLIQTFSFLDLFKCFLLLHCLYRTRQVVVWSTQVLVT